MALVLAAGLLEVCFAVGLDTIVRLRLMDAGERFVFWRGGSLDYGRYLELRRKAGWSPWPVYLIPLSLLAGIAFTVLALLRF